MDPTDTIRRGLQPGDLSEKQHAVLEQRVADADVHPERFAPWDQARARIRNGIHRPNTKA